MTSTAQKLSTIQILSTKGCHLCEIAEQLVRRLAPQVHVNIEYIDIADNDSLVEAYGIKIPVLIYVDSKQELNWPFDEEQFIAWVNAQHSENNN